MNGITKKKYFNALFSFVLVSLRCRPHKKGGSLKLICIFLTTS
uniref:Uncharacterized protein n=1 Tax=Rhizophora mucronata TaxID=61149 RepID=A0A2P2KDL2_RHIMU